MKAFKKWLKENNVRLFGISYDLERLEACKISAEIAYQAAYKTALKNVLALNSVRIHDDVYDDIKKALEENDESI